MARPRGSWDRATLTSRDTRPFLFNPTTMSDVSSHSTGNPDHLTAFERLPLHVLREICFILVRPSQPKGQSCWDEALALAVTSRALSGPALDVIWYKIPDLAILLRTIREECWKIERINSEPQFLFVSIHRLHTFAKVNPLYTELHSTSFRCGLCALRAICPAHKANHRPISALRLVYRHLCACPDGP